MNTDFAATADRSKLETVAAAMTERGFSTQVVGSKEEALSKLIEMIPAGAELMTGSSTSLNEIGFTEFLKTKPKGWKNLHDGIWSEENKEKQTDLRRHSTTAEYFVSSVNAVTEDGMLVAVDATGSRVGALPFAAKHVVFVIGAQKITKDLEDAMQRIRQHVFPLEDVRAQAAYGMGSAFAKWVILEREFEPNRIQVLLVEESLGF